MKSAYRSFVILIATAMSTSAFGDQASTIKQYQFRAEADHYILQLKEVPSPIAGANDVLVRVRAASLNRRDIYMMQGAYGPGGNVAGAIPLSDGAGEVIAVGDDVTRFKVGDRVAGTFFPKWIEGPPNANTRPSARGGSTGGMLSEIIVSHEDGLVMIPEHLSFEEAATLPCAAVTAWSGMFKRGNLQPDEYVLLEGTGGVSTFGLLFATAAGAKAIITSSQDEKLKRAKELGAFGTVNYRKNPDWQKKVREFTGGAGVSQVLEVGGQGTLGKAIEALAYGGHIALIGGLSGFGGELPVGALMLNNASASGIYVGSREDFEAMNRFISKHQIHPLIDRVFDFHMAAEAIAHMDSGNFMGKIVIRL